MKKDMAAGTDDSPQKTQPGILRGATLPLRSTSTDMFSLVQILQQAIRVGDEQQAKEIASQLAKRRAAVIMDVSIDSPLDTYLSNDIRVKVYVEDKDSSGVCVVLKLKPSMTIKQLKSKMLIEYSFPPEVQKWIIGKRIAEDNDTLFKCGIKSTGMSMFLYLISPKSIGLSKEKIMQKYRHILRNESPVSESPDVGQESIRSKTIKVKREIENPVQNTISVPAPELSQPTQSINASMENTHKSTAKTPSEEMKGRWECSACTFFNIPTRPGCEICGQPRPADFKVPEGYVIPQEELDRLAAEQEAERLAREAEVEEEQRRLAQSIANYEHMLVVDNQDMIPNTEEFDCPVCFDTVELGAGVILRECLHKFCRECLSGQVEHSDTPEVKCPYQDNEYACSAVLPEREIKAIVTADVYRKYLQRSLTRAENVTPNSYHCKTADCRGWCIYEDAANFFTCPICLKTNCLTCKAIHEGMNCRQYQDDLKIRAQNDVAAKQTQDAIQEMLNSADAMNCPTCNIIVQKKDGCDWVMCTMCQTEICWVTRGPRWGPLGEGDTSGGCRCREDGQPCHPDCVNCH